MRRTVPRSRRPIGWLRDSDTVLLRRRSDPLGDGALARVGKRWHQLNLPFTLNDHLGPDSGPCTLVVPGERPIVCSAPHAVHHSRHGVVKLNDANTGGLALALAEHLGGSAIALRRGGLEFGDPNHDREHPLKDVAAPLVGPGVVFLDLHGMADRDHDVIIGIGATPTARSFHLAERFANAAVRNGISAAVADDDTGFNANGPATMTMWALGRGADALQIEIARNLRSVRADPERRIAVLRAIVQVFGD
jgi:hypothetical protein